MTSLAASWKNVSVLSNSFSEREPLLMNICGIVPKGGMTCVIGENNSGKTLLLKLLSMRCPNDLFVTGNLSLSGSPVQIYRNSVKAIYNVAFLPTEDVGLTAALTVRETLELAWKAQMNKYSNKEFANNIEQFIENFQLKAVEHSRIGSINQPILSGGEKRRLSIALELIGKPSLLALDEPTSGLDSKSSIETFQVIKQFVRDQGLGVIATLNQPSRSLMELFDYVCILNNHSQAYFGPISSINNYFSSLGFSVDGSSSADYFLYIINRRNQIKHRKFTKTTKAELSRRISISIRQSTMDEISNIYSDETQGNASDFDFNLEFSTSTSHIDLNQQITRDQEMLNYADTALLDEAGSHLLLRDRDSWRNQFIATLIREGKLCLRDPEYYRVQFVSCTISYFLMGTLFYQSRYIITNKPSTLMFSNFLLMLIRVAANNSITMVYFFSNQEKLYYHEIANGRMSNSVWSITELLIRMIMGFIVVLPGVLISCAMVGYPEDAQGYTILMAYLVYFSCSLLTEITAYYIGNSTNAVAVITLCLGVLGIFNGGTLIRWNELGNWAWLDYISPLSWGSKGLLITTHKEISYECDPNNVFNGSCSYLGYSLSCIPSIDPTCFVSGFEFVTNVKALSSTYSAGMCAGWLIFILSMLYGNLLLIRRYPLKLLKFAFVKAIGFINVFHFVHYQRLKVVELESYIKLTNKQKSDMEEIKFSPRESSVKTSQFIVNSLNSYNPSDLVLSWSNLSVYTLESRCLLNQVSGNACSGRVVGILGGSGAGKTTLLNMIGNRLISSKLIRSGDILLNGSPVTLSDIGFCPQFLHMDAYLSVKESLVYVYKLFHTDHSNVGSQVQQILSEVDMQAKEDVNVEKLSHGEKKRLKLACIILSRARLVLFDEITTNLDDLRALELLGFIRRAVKAHNLICLISIHQPSSKLFELLDDVILLNKGEILFSGPRIDIVALANYNAGENKILTIPEIILNSPTLFQSEISQPLQFENVPIVVSDNKYEIQHHFILMLNISRFYFRTVSIFRVRAMGCFILGVFLGSLFANTNASLASINIMAGAIFAKHSISLTLMSTGTPELFSMRLSFDDQYRSNYYSLLEYTMAMFLAPLPCHLLVAIILNVPFIFMISFNTSFETFCISTILNMLSFSFMDCISRLFNERVNNLTVSTTMSYAYVAILFNFSTFFVPKSASAPAISWLTYLFPMQYILRADLIETVGNLSIPSGQSVVDGRSVLKKVFDVQDEQTTFNQIGILLLFILLINILYIVFVSKRFRAPSKKF